MLLWCLLLALIACLPLVQALDAAPRKLDTTTLVVMGEGLAAGFSNFSLSEEVQTGAFPSLLAKQTGTILPTAGLPGSRPWKRSRIRQSAGGNPPHPADNVSHAVSPDAVRLQPLGSRLDGRRGPVAAAGAALDSGVRPKADPDQHDSWDIPQ